MPERLDRLLASQGPWSRKEAKRLVKAGRVLVDGRAPKGPEEKVDPSRQEIRVDGVPLRYRRHRHYLVHKPPGYLSATRDEREAVVLELLPPEERKNLALAGRLDKDAEGLILLTTDGELAHRVTHPKHKLEKTYEVWLDAPVGEEEVRRFAEGVAGFSPARLVPLSGARARVTISEGKYHQVKRMFGAVGRRVKRLLRTNIGPLSLEGLAPGEWRELSPSEEEALYRAVRLDRGR